MSAENIIHEKTREIKKELRLAMNGVVSSLQRNQGLNYKINFGVEIPRLKGIAANHPKDKELALRLWQDDIRECKILAILLLPEEEYPLVAGKWIEETPFTEIADHLAMNILCKIPDAAAKAIEWIEKEEGMFRYCGFMTISHLLRNGTRLDKSEEERFLKSINRVGDTDNRGAVALAARNTIMLYSASIDE